MSSVFEKRSANKRLHDNGSSRSRTRASALRQNKIKTLVTGSSGHLGEALVRTLRALTHDIVSLDLIPTPFTTHIGSINDRALVRECMKDMQTVYHTATLHKPHVVTHQMHEFVETNINGVDTFGGSSRNRSIRICLYKHNKHFRRTRRGQMPKVPRHGLRKMFDGIDRVYINSAARRDLGWRPKYSFSYLLDCLIEARAPRSELAAVVGSKAYHSKVSSEGPYPV